MEMMSMKTLNTSALVTADSPKGQRATETFRAQYNKAGLNDKSAQILNEHPGFAVYLAEGIRRFSAKAPDYGLAQSILGADFITPEELSKARPSIVYTVEQITALAESLPSEDVLKWCKDNGYAVMPAPPTAMSTLDVREIQSAHFYSKTGVYVRTSSLGSGGDRVYVGRFDSDGLLVDDYWVDRRDDRIGLSAARK